MLLITITKLWQFSYEAEQKSIKNTTCAETDTNTFYIHEQQRDELGLFIVNVYSSVSSEEK